MSIEKMTLVQMSGNLGKFSETLRKCSDSGNFQLEQAPATNDKLTEQDLKAYMEQLADLGITKNVLTACSFLKIRFGRIPTSSASALKKHSDDLFVFVSLDDDGDYTWGVYITPVGSHAEVDGLFYSLYFEHVLLPGQVNDFVQPDVESAAKGTPADIERSAADSEKQSDKRAEDNPYKAMLSKIIAISDMCGIDLHSEPVEDTRSFDRNSASAYLDKFNERLTQLVTRKKELAVLTEQLETALKQIEHLQKLEYDLDEISNLQYIYCFFGRVPKSVAPVLPAFDEYPVAIVPIDEDASMQWFLCFTPRDCVEAVNEALSSLPIEKIKIPSEAHGTPAQAKISMTKQIEDAQTETAQIANDLKKSIEDSMDTFIYFYSRIKLLNEESESQLKTFKAERKYRLVGFIPKLLCLDERKRALGASIEQSETALIHLSHMLNLDVNLDDIFSCKYLQVRFGRLPKDSYQKLSYFSDKLFVFVSFSEDQNYVWGAYFAPTGLEKEADDVFNALFWERIWIPKFVHGAPGSAKKALEATIEQNQKEIASLKDEMKSILSTRVGRVEKIYNKIKFNKSAYEMRRRVKIINDKFYMVGFVPQKEAPKFVEDIKTVGNVEVEVKPHNSDRRLKAPTKLKNNRLFKPFEMFIDMYGLPSYTDIDPTPFLAISYSLLFGIMFGDVGQGLVIALVGLILSKWKGMVFGKILERIGCVSAVFGLLYGSVFGLEHVLDPFYINVLGLHEKPIEVMNPDTINMLLIAALGVGVVLIIISILVNICVSLRNKDLEKGLFSNNGIIGLVFYVSVLAAAALMMLKGVNLFTPVYIILLIVFPLIVMMFKQPVTALVKGRKFKMEGGFGDFILENFFEMFDVLLSYITNTMSFLRVGGFIISHAGMMMVVLTLAEMVGNGGNIFVMIFGNAFVMCLEGFIVGIQALRLEFYEMFGRYYEGQGKPFVPLKM